VTGQNFVQREQSPSPQLWVDAAFAQANEPPVHVSTRQPDSLNESTRQAPQSFRSCAHASVAASSTQAKQWFA
jgi:hypothetical protein